MNGPTILTRWRDALALLPYLLLSDLPNLVKPLKESTANIFTGKSGLRAVFRKAFSLLRLLTLIYTPCFAWLKSIDSWGVNLV